MRKVIVFGLVLLMASCSLWAFPISKKSLEKEAPEPAPVVVEIVEAPAMEEATSTQEELQSSQEAQRVAELEAELLRMSESLKSLQGEINQTKLMTSSKKDEISTIVDAIASDVDIVLADLAEKEAIITELAEANASQADKLAYLQGKYDKEISSKFFTKIGGAFGIQNDKIKLGLVGDMGIRLGKGLMIGTGVQFMGFTLDDGIKCDWSTDNLTVNMTIGWEW